MKLYSVTEAIKMTNRSIKERPKNEKREKRKWIAYVNSHIKEASKKGETHTSLPCLSKEDLGTDCYEDIKSELRNAGYDFSENKNYRGRYILTLAWNRDYRKGGAT